MNSSSVTTVVEQNFSDLKTAVRARMEALATRPLFKVEVPKDLLWEAYISVFPESVRQGYNCNSCRSFIKNYGGVVSITDDYQIETIWQVEVPGYYQAVVDSLHGLVSMGVIDTALVVDSRDLGTDYNFSHSAYASSNKGPVVRWEHLYAKLPTSYPVVSRDRLSPVRGEMVTRKEVLLRSLREIKLEHIDRVLLAIGQNDLYRGAEKKQLLLNFRDILLRFKSIPIERTNNFVWLESSLHPNECHMRNDVIGTLLVDLSSGTSWERAKREYESRVSPTTYRRPVATVTSTTRDIALAKIKDLGLLPSLSRTTVDSIPLDHCLHVHRPVTTELTVLDEISLTIPVNPKSLQRVPTKTLAQLQEELIPEASTISVLVEPRLTPNLVSLVGPQREEDPLLFKWSNAYSWSYNGSVADSIKERVKAQGGEVNALVRISLSWNNYDDLDLHLLLPDRREVFYGDKHIGGIKLDVDMNAGGRRSKAPVENIVFSHTQSHPKGPYEIVVDNFCKREHVDEALEVEVEYNSEIYKMYYPNGMENRRRITVGSFVHTSDGKFDFSSIKSRQTTTPTMSGSKVWGVNLGTWVRANTICLSPNYWTEGVGNKHIFFFLEGCKSLSPRSFFNEFLRSEFESLGRFFEALGDLAKVEVKEPHLAGLGFSFTKKDHFFVKVDGCIYRVEI